MKTLLRVFALGTYYTTHSNVVAPNMWEMRRLVWWAKADPTKSNRSIRICFPGEESFELNSCDVAYDRVAQQFNRNISRMRRERNIGSRPLALVPVPSSVVTRADIQTARWSGREIGRRLERLGVGRLRLPLVNASPVPQKTSGADIPWQQLRSNFVRTDDNPKLNEVVVYIDDLLTWGDHIWAVHAAMGSSSAFAMVIATNDSEPRDALQPRSRFLSLTKSEKPDVYDCLDSFSIITAQALRHQ